MANYQWMQHAKLLRDIHNNRTLQWEITGDTTITVYPGFVRRSDGTVIKVDTAITIDMSSATPGTLYFLYILDDGAGTVDGYYSTEFPLLSLPAGSPTWTRATCIGDVYCEPGSPKTLKGPTSAGGTEDNIATFDAYGNPFRDSGYTITDLQFAIPIHTTDDLKTVLEGASDGDMFYLETGTHNVTEKITISADICVFGCSSSMIKVDMTTSDTAGLIVNSHVKFLGPKFYIVDDNIFSVGSSGHLFLNCCTLEGDATTPGNYGIYMNGGAQVTALKSVWTGSMNSAIVLASGSADTQAILIGCTFDGVDVKPYYGDGFVMTGCVLDGSHFEVTATASKGYNVSSNTFTNNTGTIVKLNAGGIFTGNMIYGATAARAIWLVSDAVITNNYIYTKDDGIFIASTSSDKAKISGNHIEVQGSSGRGIQLYSGSAIITGNVVELTGTSTEAMIDVGSSATKAIVVNNEAYAGASGKAIQIDSSLSNIICKNNYYTGTFSAPTDGTNGNIVYDNVEA